MCRVIHARHKLTFLFLFVSFLYDLFSSDNEGGICFRPHARVRLSVCVQDYWKTRAWICMKRCVSTDVGNIELINFWARSGS